MIDIFITFAAFILAFSQFLKPITIFRLSLGFVKQDTLLEFMKVIGIIAIMELVAKWVFYPIYKESFWFISTGHLISIFWFGSLTFIIIYLFSLSFRPSKFSLECDKRYRDGCYLIIASGVENDLNKLAEEIGEKNNIKMIFDLAHQSAVVGKTSPAYELVELFSDELFCKAIVNRNPWTLYNILLVIKEHPAFYEGYFKKLVNRLILLMFTEDNSILYREEPGYGLGRFGRIKSLVFSDIKFLSSEYRPLSNWMLGGYSKFNKKSIKKYFEIIEFAFDSYLQKGDCSNPEVIWAALDNIAEIIKSTFIFQGQLKTNLNEFFLGLSSLIRFIEDKDKENFFPADNFDAKEEDYSFFKADKTIYGALADGIYQIIESLALSDDNESIRLLMLDIYPRYGSKTSKILTAISQRLDILFKEKITQNLIQLFFPAITAKFTYAFGLCEPEKASLPIHQFLLTMLKREFISAYKRNSELTLQMLPSDTEYDEATKILRRKGPMYFRDKKLQILKLDEPN